MPDISYRPLTANATDKQAYHALVSEEYAELYGNMQQSIDELRVFAGILRFNLSTDTYIAVLADGTLVGVAEVWALSDTPVRPQIRLYVLPSYRESDVSETLLLWALERAKQVIDRLPDEARVVAELRTPFVDFDALLEKRGFAVHHTHSRKRIDFDDRPPPASFPAGYQIVTMREHPHLIDFIRVYRTAFRTMRGFVEDALENRVARWQKDIDMHGDYFDPSYFVLVRDEQDNDAAVLMAWTTSRENSEEAWISIVGTLPEYRRQGLARNLLYHAFNRFYEDGKKAAALTVDDASLTGANDLYSKVGMRTVQTIRVYARELRAGVEYSVQA